MGACSWLTCSLHAACAHELPRTSSALVPPNSQVSMHCRACSQRTCHPPSCLLQPPPPCPATTSRHPPLALSSPPAGLVATPVLLYALNPPEIKDTPKAPEQAKKRLQELGPLTRWVGQGTAGSSWGGLPLRPPLTGAAPVARCRQALLHAVLALRGMVALAPRVSSLHAFLVLPRATGTL